MRHDGNASDMMAKTLVRAKTLEAHDRAYIAFVALNQHAVSLLGIHRGFSNLEHRNKHTHTHTHAHARTHMHACTRERTNAQAIRSKNERMRVHATT